MRGKNGGRRATESVAAGAYCGLATAIGALYLYNVRWKQKEYKTTNDKGAVAGDAACGQAGVANHEPA